MTMKENLTPEQTQELAALGCGQLTTLTSVIGAVPLTYRVEPDAYASLSMQWDGSYGEEWEVGYADVTTHSEELIDALFELIKLLIDRAR